MLLLNLAFELSSLYILPDFESMQDRESKISVSFVEGQTCILKFNSESRVSETASEGPVSCNSLGLLRLPEQRTTDTAMISCTLIQDKAASFNRSRPLAHSVKNCLTSQNDNANGIQQEIKNNQNPVMMNARESLGLMNTTQTNQTLILASAGSGVDSSTDFVMAGCEVVSVAEGDIHRNNGGFVDSADPSSRPISCTQQAMTIQTSQMPPQLKYLSTQTILDDQR